MPLLSFALLVRSPCVLSPCSITVWDITVCATTRRVPLVHSQPTGGVSARTASLDSIATKWGRKHVNYVPLEATWKLQASECGHFVHGLNPNAMKFRGAWSYEEPSIESICFWLYLAYLHCEDNDLSRLLGRAIHERTSFSLMPCHARLGLGGCLLALPSRINNSRSRR